MKARTILIGLVAVIVLGIVTPICDLFYIGSLIGSTYMPVGTIFLFFFFVFILNTLLKILKISLTPQELLLIYAMMVIGSGIPSYGFVVHLIPIISAPFYYATPENRFAEIFHKFIPDWMSPKNPETIKYLYEGLPKGMNIPYKDWIMPLFWWTLLALAIYLVMFCLSIIVRKQWVENEKLVFPLVYPPIEMVKEENKSLLPSFFKNKLMWLAFLIPAVVYTIKGLHFYFPAIPDIKLAFVMQKYFTEKPWNSISIFWIKIIFSVIGFTYLIPTSLSFSLWFFYLFFQFQTIIGCSLGFQMPLFPGTSNRAFHGYQVAGGIIAFAILLFWAMRNELKDMIKTKSFRLAIFGLIFGFLFICFWAMLAGVKFWAIFFWAIIFFLIVIVTTRLVAEGGLFYVHHTLLPLELIFPFTGSVAIGSSSIFTLLAFNHIFAREGRVYLMPFFLNNLKIAEVSKMKNKKLIIGMWLSIILIIIVSYITILNLMYKYGGINLANWWTNVLPKEYVSGRTAQYISSPVSPSFKDALTMSIGAGVMVFLFWMRRIFLWWPFHPLGYIMGGGFAMHHIWFSTMLGWLIKTIILKFGGIKIYQKLMLLFLGLILGTFVTVGAWVVIDLITGAKGNFLL